MIIIAVSYGMLIKEYPVSGGEFAYAYIGFGRTHAFICGWFLTLGYICIVALNASALSLMVKFIAPQFINQGYLYRVAGWDVYGPEVLIGMMILILFAVFNVRGSIISGRIQFLFCLVMILSVFIVALFMTTSTQTSIANMKPFFSPTQTTFTAIISIIAIAPWAFVGFDNVPQVAEEFNFSSRKAFKLIVFALIAAAVLYTLMIYATAIAMPWIQLSEANYIWGTGEAIHSVMGSSGFTLLVIALTMGIFTGLNGFIISSSRLLFAMSRAKMLPTFFSKLHSKSKVPYVSIWFVIFVSMIAPWFGRAALIWVVDMSSIGVSIAYFYTCFTAYKKLAWTESFSAKQLNLNVSLFKKSIAFLGSMLSLGFIALLIIPNSPAYLSIQSRVALIVWIIIGLFFYISKRKKYNTISEEELHYLITGKN